MNPLREIVIPTSGSPHWLNTGEPLGGLVYLSWGHRRYGQHPIPLRVHDGWTYTVITEGHPLLVVGNTRRRLAPGSLVMAGPDVPMGWEDQGKALCSILAWIWKSHSMEKTSRKLCWIRSVSSTDLRTFVTLHQDTRREITLADSHTPDILSALHLRLDAELERAAGTLTRSVSRDSQHLQLARSWMSQHLDARSPAAALADYLGISPMTLSRLFRRAANSSPGETFLEMKMQRAAELLSVQRASVKSVALELGYRHSGDFSRAFARFHGCSPKTFGPRSQPK